MGHLNLVEEEADSMERSCVRSLWLASALIVFSLLLVVGGPRLIGHADDYGTGVTVSAIPLSAAISQAPQRAEEETGLSNKPVSQMKRLASVPVQPDRRLPAQVVSDANGNVLRCDSYLHTVYQSFSLGDGFV